MNYMDLIRSRGTLLVAHRGVAGANIPCNSLQAFAAALHQGADLVELDVETSRDGVLFVQHPGMERVHLRREESLKQLPADIIRGLTLSNCDLAATDQYIPTLEQALTAMKGKTIVNIDKFWENPEKIAWLVRKHGMQDQVLIKTAESGGRFEDVIRYGSDLPYMAIVDSVDENYGERLAKLPRWVGVECLFREDSAPVAGQAYREKLHRDGKFNFVNALVYDYHAVLSGGHNDDISIVGREEEGWGWLADRFDVIQTDFLLACRLFLERTGRRRKL